MSADWELATVADDAAWARSEEVRPVQGDLADELEVARAEQEENLQAALRASAHTWWTTQHDQLGEDQARDDLA